MFVTKVTHGLLKRGGGANQPSAQPAPSVFMVIALCISSLSAVRFLKLSYVPVRSVPCLNVPVQRLCLDCLICSFWNVCSQDSGFLPQLQRIHQLPWIRLYNLPLFFFKLFLTPDRPQEALAQQVLPCRTLEWWIWLRLCCLIIL